MIERELRSTYGFTCCLQSQLLNFREKNTNKEKVERELKEAK